MRFNRGISGNRDAGKHKGIGNLEDMISKVKGGIKVGRVTDIILNKNYPEIKKYGGLNSIGTIFFEMNDFVSGGDGIAIPFFPQMSSYPLVNELVLIFKLPNTNIGKVTSEESYYYINMISLWNHPHHNAYPNPLTNSGLEPSQQKDYEQTTAGSVRRVTDSETSISLNSPNNPSQATFVERINIHPLLPFAGDVIHEGRWGNSIRLSSTAYNRSSNIPPLNPWSNLGLNGEPITLIRNGQSPLSSEEGWVPIVENINQDLSSIYLTSTQQIPIVTNPVFFNGARYSSYTPSVKELPTSISSFTGNQVIINSGRLVFNSKTDHIMLSSKRTISFEAIKGFNFDTNENFVIQAGTTIKLGSKDATEPLVKGEALRVELFNLCTNLKQLVSILKYSQVTVGKKVADNALSLVAATTEEALNRVLTSVTKDSNDNTPILSKISKTI